MLANVPGDGKTKHSFAPQAMLDAMDTDDKTITLNPSPGFVIKTHLLKSRNKRDQGIKVFINACTDPRIPQPEEVYGEELFMRIQNGEDWIVPIVVSKQREDVDRAGKRALVWDCCMHPRVVLEATKDKGVKVILIETCIELVEDSSSVELSREYVTPKLLQKGELEKTVVSAGALRKDKGFVGTLDSALGEALSLKDAEGDAPMVDDTLIKQGETKRLKKPLIQEIASSEATAAAAAAGSAASGPAADDDAGPGPSVTFSVGEYKGPYSGEGPAPKYRVEVGGVRESDVADSETVVLDDDRRTVRFLGKKVVLPAACSRVEAFFTADTRLLHVFAY